MTAKTEQKAEPKAEFKTGAGPRAGAGAGAGTETKESKLPNIHVYMEAQKKELKAALPKHMDVDKFKRIAMTELRKSNDLNTAAQRNPLSFFGACIQAAQLGLEPGSGLGHCYLIPFNEKKNGVIVNSEVTLIIGYKGMIELVNRSDRLDYFLNMPVLMGDRFSYKIQTPAGIMLEHEPDLDNYTPTMDNVRLIYCLAKVRGGGVIPELMTKQAILDNEKQHRKGKEMPKAWRESWVQMARKTVIRRIYNYLPKSTEMQGVADVEDRDGRGMADFARLMGLDKIPENAVPAEGELTANAGDIDDDHQTATEVNVEDIGDNVVDAEATDPALDELVNKAKNADTATKPKRG